MHWTTRWLGRAWVEGEYECTDFAAEVLREEFGRAVDVPSAPAGTRARDQLLIRELRSRARPVDAPVDGDLVLMRMAAGVRLRAWHLGLYAAGGGVAPCVLHCARDDGAQVHRIDELGVVLGYALEGYYRCAP